MKFLSQPNREACPKFWTPEVRIPRIFGFGTLELTQAGKTDHEIIIYPDRLAVHNEEMRNQIPQGLFAQKNALFNDPLLTTGAKIIIRMTTCGTSMWKATARTGDLQTRMYEKTTRISWLILLNLRSERNYAPPGNIEEIFEKLGVHHGKRRRKKIFRTASSPIW